MNVSWEKTEKHTGKLTVSIDGEFVTKALDKAFKKVSKDVSLPGFRKGKVPRAMFDKRFGQDALLQDALDVILKETYPDALEQSGVEPVTHPEIDLQEAKLEAGKPYQYTAVITVTPEVKLPEYKGLKVELEDMPISDEDVNGVIEGKRRESMVLEPVVDGEAASEDDVIIDFKGFIDDEPFPGGSAEKYTLTLGSGQFIPGFEDQVMGMRPGEDRDVTVSFPAEYHVEDLAGKPAKFQVKLHEIKRPLLPELNDDFAKDVSDFDTLEELRADVKRELLEEAARDKEQHLRVSLLREAVNDAEIDIPEVMISDELKNVKVEFRQRLARHGMDEKEFLENNKETNWDDKHKEIAEQRVREMLVINAIAKAEDIKVTHEEVVEEFKRGDLDAMLRSEAGYLISTIDKQGNPVLNWEKTAAFIQRYLTTQRVLDLLVSNSQNKA